MGRETGYAKLVSILYYYSEFLLFTVYHSNQVDVLKSLLVELIRREPLSNPFDKEHILVQSSGMSQWLKMELAKELKVVANVDFALPASFIWDLFTRVLQDVPARSAFNKEAMCWKLMKILPAQLSRPEFELLDKYLIGDDSGTKLFQLAEKIADTFDGYLVYRPEWVASWEAGEPVSELEGEHPWQPILWQELYDYTLQIGQSPFHRANLYEHFIDTIESYSTAPECLPSRLFVFGISSLPPRYLDALKAIGRHIDVHLMFTNPCRYYWGEVRDRKFLAKLAAKHRQHVEWKEAGSEPTGTSEQLKGDIEQNINDELHTSEVGNSLLASMGKLGRDNLYLLAQLECHEIEAFVDINRHSTLNHLQADILNLEEHQNDQAFETSTHKQSVQKSDHSLSIHVCHSPIREVEVLHDQLLTMFSRNPSLSPRDVIVMVADINSYSPSINAVFSNAPAERFIPFAISDLSADVENPILKAFVKLVELPSSRCSVSELLEILETPAILAKMSINEVEFDLIRRWVEESGVRWGIDQHTGEDFDLPQIKQNTWQFGLERMLLGYAMSEDAGLFNQESDSFAPYDEVQGLDAELAGKLTSYIQVVGDYRQRLKGSHDIETWKAILFDMLDDFFDVDVQGEVALKTLRDTVNGLKNNIDESQFDASFPHNIIAQYLKDKLSGARVSQRFLAGQVNFCTLMPMRSIPFKVVCLLGMNDGVYPRSIPPESFDLLAGRARPGDRSRRIDDRYLFLEAMLSAQESLYVSYVGRSIEKNTEKVPSVLVSEVLDYCHQNYCIQGDEGLPVDESGDNLVQQLIRMHPMTPFSPAAFVNGSYAKEWLPAAKRQTHRLGNANTELDDYFLGATFPLELELAEFHKFWRLPVKYFFNRRLKVYLNSDNRAVEDDEPFTLNNLQSYSMRDSLLASLLTDRDGEENREGQTDERWAQFLTQQRAMGNLPLAAFGTLEFDAQRQQVEQLYAKITALANQAKPDIELSLPINLNDSSQQVILTGWVGDYFDVGLIRYRNGRIRCQDRLSAWIDHLCVAAMGIESDTYVLGLNNKNLECKAYASISDKEFAKQQLSQLLRLYMQGMNQPLAYFPETAYAYLNAENSKQPSPEKSLQKMVAQFNGDDNVRGDKSNLYVARIWPKWSDDLSIEVQQLSRSILEVAYEKMLNEKELVASRQKS